MSIYFVQLVGLNNEFYGLCSCYANAVLQCLTSTKPLLIYLLRRMHSRSCISHASLSHISMYSFAWKFDFMSSLCFGVFLVSSGVARDFCLMCELEVHVSMLRESGGPLSASKILSNMRKIGLRIGGGTQEDAHEFLRRVFLINYSASSLSSSSSSSL